MVTPLTYILNAFNYGAGLGIAFIAVATGSWLLSMLRDEFPVAYAVIMWIVGIIMAVVMVAALLTELVHRDKAAGRHRKITKMQRMLTAMHNRWEKRRKTDDYEFFHELNLAKEAEPKPLW